MLARVQAELCAVSAPIAHVKLLLETPGGKLAANLTSSRGGPLVRGVVNGSPREAMLVVNARVGTGPDQLRSVVTRCLRASAGDTVKARFTELDSFSPRYPEPEHRFDFVVQAKAPQGETGQR